MLKRIAWTLIIVGIAIIVEYGAAVWVGFLNTYYPLTPEFLDAPGIDRTILFPMLAAPFIVALMGVWGALRDKAD